MLGVSVTGARDNPGGASELSGEYVDGCPGVKDRGTDVTYGANVLTGSGAREEPAGASVSCGEYVAGPRDLTTGAPVAGASVSGESVTPGAAVIGATVIPGGA